MKRSGYKEPNKLLDDVLNLINDAKLEDKEGKIDNLAQIQEVCFHRDVSLIPEVAPLVAEFQTDKADRVRIEVVQFLREATLREPRVATSFLAVATFLLYDNQHRVLQKVIGALQKIYPKLLTFYARANAGVEPHRAGMKGNKRARQIPAVGQREWASLTELKQTILAFANGKQIGAVTQNEQLSATALKYLEAVVKTFARIEEGEIKIPPKHPFLRHSELKLEAEKITKAMLRLLDNPKVGGLWYREALNILKNLGKYHPTYFGLVSVQLAEKIMTYYPPELATQRFNLLGEACRDLCSCPPSRLAENVKWHLTALNDTLADLGLVERKGEDMEHDWVEEEDSETETDPDITEEESFAEMEVVDKVEMVLENLRNLPKMSLPRRPSEFRGLIGLSLIQAIEKRLNPSQPLQSPPQPKIVQRSSLKDLQPSPTPKPDATQKLTQASASLISKPEQLELTEKLPADTKRNIEKDAAEAPPKPKPTPIQTSKDPRQVRRGILQESATVHSQIRKENKGEALEKANNQEIAQEPSQQKNEPPQEVPAPPPKQDQQSRSFQSMSVYELRRECQRRKLNWADKKKDVLLARLLAHTAAATPTPFQARGGNQTKESMAGNNANTASVIKGTVEEKAMNLGKKSTGQVDLLGALVRRPSKKTSKKAPKATASGEHRTYAIEPIESIGIFSEEIPESSLEEAEEQPTDSMPQLPVSQSQEVGLVIKPIKERPNEIFLPDVQQVKENEQRQQIEASKTTSEQAPQSLPQVTSISDVPDQLVKGPQQSDSVASETATPASQLLQPDTGVSETTTAMPTPAAVQNKDPSQERMLPQVQIKTPLKRKHPNGAVRQPATPKRPKLTNADIRKLGIKAFHRILDSSAKPCKGKLKKALVSNLTLLMMGEPHQYLPGVPPLVQVVIDFCVKDYYTRYPIALSLLRQIHFMGKDYQQELYSAVFYSLLQALEGALEPKDKLSKEDKMFPKTLLEAPRITPEALELVNRFCQDTSTPGRVTLGLMTLRDIILERPADSLRCLKLALSYTDNECDDLRAKVTRLMINKVWEISCLQTHIRDHAKEALFSAAPPIIPLFESMINGDAANQDVLQETQHANESSPDPSTANEIKNIIDQIITEIEKLPEANPISMAEGKSEHEKRNTKTKSSQGETPAQSELIPKPSTSNFLGGGDEDDDDDDFEDEPLEEDTNTSKIKWSKLLETAEDVRHRLTLYLALCTKEKQLFPGLFLAYAHTEPGSIVQQGIERELPQLVRALAKNRSIGSCAVVNLMSGAPENAHKLVMNALDCLVPYSDYDDPEGIPSDDLNMAIQELRAKRGGSLEYLVVLFRGFKKEAIERQIPALLTAGKNTIRSAIRRAVGRSPPCPMTPADFMVMLHRFDHEKHGIGLRKVMVAMDLCFEEKVLFGPEVLKKTLEVLSSDKDIPLAIMRTTMLSITKYPTLKHFVAYVVLIRLIEHEVWTKKRIWDGFIKCVRMMSSDATPNAFLALVQLPLEHFKHVIALISPQFPSIRESLKIFSENTEYKSVIKNEIFEELGLLHAVVEEGEVS